eukprot:gene7842-9351_t
MAEPELTIETQENGKNNTMNCRFYEKLYPAPEELVLVKVTDVGDMGAYAKLLEYNDMEGFILLPEMGRRRVRSKATRLKVNRLEVVRVIRVDKEKGYIDLSKRTVGPEDIEKCHAKYTKAKAVHSVLSHVAKSNDMRLEDLCAKVGWPLYAKFGHAYDAFKIACSSTGTEEPIDIFADLDVSKKLKKKILKHIKQNGMFEPITVSPEEALPIGGDGSDGTEYIQAGESEEPTEEQKEVEVWQFVPDCEHTSSVYSDISWQ